MSKKKATSQVLSEKIKPELVLQIRVMSGAVIAFGPGKADLLKHLEDTGSLQASAARMNMSYMKAWRLVRDMNACFSEPLVLAARGGAQQGGSQITEAGRSVLKLYLQMQRDADKASNVHWRMLARKLR